MGQLGYKACAITCVLALLAAGGWLVWQGMLKIPPDAARLLLLLALAALPLVAWAGWYFGHVEATGRLQGIDQSVDKIMGGLTKAAMLKVGTAHAMRQVATPQAPPPVLPDVEIVPRLPVGDVIDI